MYMPIYCVTQSQKTGPCPKGAAVYILTLGEAKGRGKKGERGHKKCEQRMNVCNRFPYPAPHFL